MLGFTSAANHRNVAVDDGCSLVCNSSPLFAHKAASLANAERTETAVRFFCCCGFLVFFPIHA